MTGRFQWGGAREAIKCSAGDIAAVGHGWFYKVGNGIKYVTGFEIFIIDSKFLTAEKLNAGTTMQLFIIPSKDRTCTAL